MKNTHSGVGHQRSHREVLLREGLNQFFDRGYHGTTVDGLLEATGVPKGSFYHHFGSKEAFALQVLERYGSFHHARLTEWAAREGLGTADSLAGYFEELAHTFVASGYRLTDLSGKLATEVSTMLSPLHAEIAELVRAWRAQLEEILNEGQQRGDVRADRAVADLSAAIHALVDGAFIIAAATRDENFLANIATAIRTLVTGNPRSRTRQPAHRRGVKPVR